MTPKRKHEYKGKRLVMVKMTGLMIMRGKWRVCIVACDEIF